MCLVVPEFSVVEGEGVDVGVGVKGVYFTGCLVLLLVMGNGWMGGIWVPCVFQ